MKRPTIFTLLILGFVGALALDFYPWRAFVRSTVASSGGSGNVTNSPHVGSENTVPFQQGMTLMPGQTAVIGSGTTHIPREPGVIVSNSPDTIRVARPITITTDLRPVVTKTADGWTITFQP